MNYRRKYNPDKKMYDDKPLHDYASHASDAFLYLAMHNINFVDMVPTMSPMEKMNIMNTKNQVRVKNASVSFV
jgi:hypothetical protein